MTITKAKVELVLAVEGGRGPPEAQPEAFTRPQRPNRTKP